MNQQLVYSFLMMVVTKKHEDEKNKRPEPPPSPSPLCFRSPRPTFIDRSPDFWTAVGALSLSLLQHLSQLEAIILQETPFHSCRVLSLYYLCIFAQYLGFILWYAPRLC